MKIKKRNLVIIGIVAVLGIATAIIAARGSRNATFEQDYHVQHPEQVFKIYMADKQNNDVLLERTINEKGDTLWTVDGQYPADESLVNLLLETLNTMRIREQVNQNAIPNVIKDISAHSIKVEVYEEDYLINWFQNRLQLFRHKHLATTYFVGRETQDEMGTLMYREGDKVPYVIHIPGFRGYITPRFSTNVYAWRSHRIVALNVKEIERIELDITADPAESFAIQRTPESFEMLLTQGNTVVPGFDTARVAQLVLAMNNLNFDEYAAAVPNTNLDTSFNEAPRTILRITDTNNISHEVKTYIKYTNPADRKAMPEEELYNTFDLNRMYAIIDNRDTVLIQYYVFDKILQPASFFLGHDITRE